MQRILKKKKQTYLDDVTDLTTDVLFDENVKFQFKRGTIIFATKQYSETFCFKSQVDAVLKNDTTI